MSVKLNGHQTVGKLEVNGLTPHGFKGPEAEDGPIRFETFGRRVLYRNISIVARPWKCATEIRIVKFEN